MQSNKPPAPGSEGITSILDTDLYKLTMQCAVIHSGYGDVDVTYTFTNRTPDLKITRKGYEWIQEKISYLGSVCLTDDELTYLRTTCTYFPEHYLKYLQEFRFRPEEQVKLGYHPVDAENDGVGDISLTISGTWAETILYEIPLLILVSESYFRFSDTDWNYDGQEEKAYKKGLRLLEAGCAFCEFGTRRRRSYATQEMVLRGLMRAAEDYGKNHNGEEKRGVFMGTSNVHFAHRFNLTPIGTVAHEWFMGIAAITLDYRSANAVGLEKWISCFGPGVLGIVLTDTFGTEQFLRCFKSSRPDGLSGNKRYAELFTGVRQDSGDPEGFVKLMKKFYEELEKETGRKFGKQTVVFSDSLNVDTCLQYKKFAEEYGFRTSFGVGTHLTNDFMHVTNPKRKSIPLNIVIKLSSACGSPAIKLSDNANKNTGDKKVVEEVKREIGYVEKTWWNEEQGSNMGDERYRWGGANQVGDSAGSLTN
ncbi:Quinolinate phosphoribosyl transferase [Kalaharituber pfeilii]|nr:Quinolinate phosphoribosyl transferase [Kalaharituber pfeilii]